MRHLKKFNGLTVDKFLHILDTFDENFKSLEDHDNMTYVFYFLSEDYEYMYLGNDHTFEYSDRDVLKKDFPEKNEIKKLGFLICTHIETITNLEFTGKIKQVDNKISEVNKFIKEYKDAKFKILNDMQRLKDFYEIDYELGKITETRSNKLAFWVIINL